MLLCRDASRASSKLSLCSSISSRIAPGEERGVPFVHVENGGLDSQRLQRPHAADAEDDLLADARMDVAAIQAVGDVAVVRSRFSGMFVSSRNSFTLPTSMCRP